MVLRCEFAGATVWIPHHTTLSSSPSQDLLPLKLHPFLSPFQALSSSFPEKNEATMAAKDTYNVPCHSLNRSSQNELINASCRHYRPGRYGHRPGRLVQIKEDRPEHSPGNSPGRLKFGLIVQADLTIVQADLTIVQADLTIVLADQFKSEENCPEHRPVYKLADPDRPGVTKDFEYIILADPAIV